jgi:hypothetical protein
MTTIAKELRALANAALELCRQSSVNSIAYPGFVALTDYLCLQARIMEVMAREESSMHCPELSSEDPPNPKEQP